jgi:putative ABC transport system ATP-binding protein
MNLVSALQPKATEEASFVSVRNLSRSFRDGKRTQAILKDVSLDIARGEFVSVVGRSGSGKSTLLHILGGLDSDFDGEVVVHGQALKGLSDRSRASLRSTTVGFVFQAFHLIQNISVADNVKLPSLFAGTGRDPHAQALAALAKVGMDGFAGRSPAQLSGGERQRVAIARALFHAPPLLLCDEPTGSLDAQTASEVLEVFRNLHRNGQTLVVVTHEEKMAAAAGRSLRLADGVLQ